MSIVTKAIQCPYVSERTCVRLCSPRDEGWGYFQS